MADAAPKEPRRFHAAAKDALKLARGETVLAAAKQVDSLKPKPQGKVAILENRALADRELLATGVALAQADLHDAFRVFRARFGAASLKASNACAIRIARPLATR